MFAVGSASSRRSSAACGSCSSRRRSPASTRASASSLPCSTPAWRQVFVCTLIALAIACSRSWQDAPSRSPRACGDWGVLCCVLLFVQLAIAAVMRHSFAGLAIPTFPWSTPRRPVLPAVWTSRSAIHFAHRVDGARPGGALCRFRHPGSGPTAARRLGMRLRGLGPGEPPGPADPPRGGGHPDRPRPADHDLPRPGRRPDLGDHLLADLARPP